MGVVVVIKGSHRLAVFGGWAAIVGGVLWVVKATAIMATGVQPPVVFEAASLCFPVGVVGLFVGLDDARSRPARLGFGVACAAELAAVAAVAAQYLGPAEWSPDGQSVTVLTPFITGAALGTLVSLLLVGIVVRRTGSLPGPWAGLPIVLALTFLPFDLLSLVLQTVNGRLFELPTLLVGLEWVILGAVMTRPPRRGNP